MTDREDRLIDLILQWEDLRKVGKNPTPQELVPDDPELAASLALRIETLEKQAWLSPPDPAATVIANSNSSISPQDLVVRLKEIGVLAEKQARKSLEALKASSKPVTVGRLVTQMVKAGWLTEFQAEQIESGAMGRLLIGNYLLLDRLGRGGMGEVFKGRHQMMQREVAIKTLPGKLGLDRQAVERFQREVRLLGKLHHPNIVTAFDAGDDHGTLFLVMEYVPGIDLHKVVQQSGPLPLTEVLETIKQAAEGLRYAHAQGVIHRDVKPANLLRSSTGSVKVLDLGLARITGKGDVQQADLTGSGAMMGTVDYIAPEQIENTRDVDARSDIYSLGCTFFFLLTGRPPFPEDSFLKKLMAHKQNSLPPLSEFRRDVPREVEALLHQMTAKIPSERPQTLQEVISVIDLYLRQPPRAQAGQSDEEDPEEFSIVERPTASTVVANSPIQSRKSKFFFIGLIAVVPILLFVWWSLNLGLEPSKPIAQTPSFTLKPVPSRPDRNRQESIPPTTGDQAIPNQPTRENSVPVGETSLDPDKSSAAKTEQEPPLPKAVVPLERPPAAPFLPQTIPDGKVGNYVVEFNGENSFIEVVGWEPKPHESFTVEMWVYLTKQFQKAEGGYFFSLPNLGIVLDSKRELELRVHTAPWTIQKTGHRLPNLRWIHLAVVRVPGGIRLFVDGKPIREYNENVPSVEKSHSPLIGASHAPPGFNDQATGLAGLDGIIRSVRVTRGQLYRQAFTPPQDLAPTQDSELAMIVEGERFPRLLDHSSRGHSFNTDAIRYRGINAGTLENLRVPLPLTGLLPEPASRPGFRRWQLHQKTFNSPPGAFALSPRGDQFWGGGNGWVARCDLPSFEVREIIPTRPQKFVQSIAPSPDGKKLLLIDGDNGLSLREGDGKFRPLKTEWSPATWHSPVWDSKSDWCIIPNSNSPPRLFNAANNSVELLKLPAMSTVVWSLDGKEFYYVDVQKNAIHHTSFPDLQPLGSLRLPDRWISNLALHPDGQQLALVHSTAGAGCQDTRVSLWGPGEDKVRTAFAGLGCWANAMSWLPDGKFLAIATQDGFSTLFDPFNGRVVEVTEQSYPLTAAVSADGKVTMDSFGRLFNVGGDLPKMVTAALHREPLDCQIRSTDHRLFLLHSRGLSSLSIPAPENRGHWIGDFPVRHLAVETFDGSVIVGGDREVLGLNEEHEIEWRIYPKTENPILALAAHPRQSRIALALANNSIEIWDPNGELPVATVSHPERITKMAWSPSGQKLAIVGDGTQGVVMDADGRELARHKLTPRWHSALLWNSDESGYLATAGSVFKDGEIFSASLVDNSTEGTLTPLRSTTPPIWDTGGNLWLSPKDHPGRFLPNDLTGKSLAGTLTTIRRTVELNHARLALTSDGNTLAIATDDGAVHLWDVASFRPWRTLLLPHSNLLLPVTMEGQPVLPQDDEVFNKEFLIWGETADGSYVLKPPGEESPAK